VRHAPGQHSGPPSRYPRNFSHHPSTLEVFTWMSWRDRRLFVLSQTGLVEKFVDALVRVFYPVYPSRKAWC
jgi:hypothetical protein